MRYLAVVLAVVMVLALAPMAFAVETSGPDYSSPNGHVEGFAEFLNEQDCITHKHEVYIDDPRSKVEAYLGVEYHASKAWVLGARVLCDVNNIDRDDRFIDNCRSEFGATFRFGPGLE